MTFNAYGYASMYMVGNMPMLLGASIAIIVVGCLAGLKRVIVRRANSAVKNFVRDIFLLNDHGSWLLNFGIRFLYEVFLVVCISSLIAVSKDRQENVIPLLHDAHDPDSTHAKYDTMIATIFLSLIALSITLAAVRFGYKTYV